MSARLSIRESVGAGLRFVRENIRLVALLAAIGAAVSVVIAAINLSVPALGLLAALAAAVLQAFLYAALIAAALFGAGSIGGRVAADGGRVWVAMAIVGAMMVIVMFVISIPVIIALVSGPMAPYANDLQAAGGDETAVMNVMLRFMEENPIAVLLTALFYLAVWYFLTSKVYLAAPASVDQGRILTLETWKWTKGALLSIVGARLLLLIPAYVLVFALNYLIGYPLGIDPSDPQTTVAAAQQNQIGYLLYVAAAGFLSLLIYTSLEAGLSTAIYRALKPSEQPSPPPQAG